jgi:hypothetical protein
VPRNTARFSAACLSRDQEYFKWAFKEPRFLSRVLRNEERPEAFSNLKATRRDLCGPRETPRRTRPRRAPPRGSVPCEARSKGGPRSRAEKVLGSQGQSAATSCVLQTVENVRAFRLITTASRQKTPDRRRRGTFRAACKTERAWLTGSGCHVHTTLRQAWLTEKNPKAAMCVRNVDVHVSCSSHVDAQFAASFIDPRAE